MAFYPNDQIFALIGVVFLPMSQPKIMHSLLLLFFCSVVTSCVFFLLRVQLQPLLTEIGNSVASSNHLLAEAARPTTTPTPTMPALTLDMVTTISVTTASATPVVVATSPALPTALPTRTGVVSSDVVNLRSYPALVGEIVGQAKIGDRFQIVAVSNDGLWVRVCCPLGTSEATRQSWVATEFMLIEPPLAAVQATAAITTGVAQPTTPRAVVAASQGGAEAHAVTGTVNGALVNLRSGPATTYPTMGQVSEQTKLTVTGRNVDGTWWRICCPPGLPQESWISAEFIDLAMSREQAMAEISAVTN